MTGSTLRQIAKRNNARGQASAKQERPRRKVPQEVKERLLLHNAARLADAALRGQTSVVHDLLEARADPNIPAEDGRMALHAAVFAGARDVVKELLMVRAEPNVQERVKLGTLPVQIAAWNGHTDVVKLLLGARACANKADGNGRTPLCSAAEQGHASSVRVLIEAGAQPTKCVQLVGRPPLTPLQVAKQSGNVEALRLIREASERTDLFPLVREWLARFRNRKAAEGALELSRGSSLKIREASKPVGLRVPVQEWLAIHVPVQEWLVSLRKSLTIDAALENINY